jgi:hypothetical protein
MWLLLNPQKPSIMRKVLLLSGFVLSSLLFHNVNAQVKLDWAKIIGGSAVQALNYLAKDNGDNVWVATGQGPFLNPEDVLLVKYNPSGTALFSVIYNSAVNGTDRAKDIATDPAGNLYVTGQTVLGNLADIFLLKYNSSGTLVWQRTFSTPGFLIGQEDVHNLGLDAAGNIYLGGSVIKNSTTDKDFLIVKYSSAGVLQWTKLYNGPANNIDEITDMAVDAAGNVYVTGHSIGQRNFGGMLILNTQNDYATLKFNTAGIQQWVARYGAAGLGSQEYAEGLALDAAGNVYVTGTAGTSAATVKYNSSGVQQWVQVFGASTGIGSWGYDIAADASGNAYVVGEIRNAGNDIDALAIKYNTSGAQQWSSQYGAAALSIETMRLGALDGAGNFYVAGSCDYFNRIDGDRLMIKFAPNGARLWTTIFTEAYKETSTDMVVFTPSSTAFQNPVIVVTGSTRTISSGDAVTTKHSQPIDRGSRSQLEPLTNGYAIRNLPNPFRSSTNVTYELPEAAHVTINVYDVTGRKVATLVDATRSAGSYIQRFTAGSLSKGVYHYQLVARTNRTTVTATRSMILQK